jgi:translocator protein
MTRTIPWRVIAVAVGSAFFVAALGGAMTDIGPWYLGLKQPSWKPPDWAFGPIWTTIFALCAAAGVRAWLFARDPKQRQMIIILFATNGFLNVLWSILFFDLKRPDWSLIEVGFLWLSVAALIAYLWRISRTASLLLVPYLLWVSLASTLNWGVVQLNGPFG